MTNMCMEVRVKLITNGKSQGGVQQRDWGNAYKRNKGRENN